MTGRHTRLRKSARGLRNPDGRQPAGRRPDVTPPSLLDVPEGGWFIDPYAPHPPGLLDPDPELDRFAAFVEARPAVVRRAARSRPAETSDAGRGRQAARPPARLRGR
jgi:hypothetical protein